jgi:hypothetical protein
MSNTLMPRHILEKQLVEALQDTDRERVLDSLETVVVKTFLASQGVLVSDDFVPSRNSVSGWIEWACRSSLTP